MKNKYKFISILFIVFFLSLSFVSASDFDNETMNLENTEIISANADYKSFTELQQTINDANDGDVILLNDSYINDVYTHQFTVNINKPLTLDGNGNTIDGNDMARIFTINADNVALKNLIIINGKHTIGGAISWNGNDGTIENCVFKDNTATSSAGGAIYWSGNGGKIINSNFTNNNANTSGAVALIEGNNYLIEGNNFESNTGGLGGAIRLGGNLYNITNNNFISNFARVSGGAIRIEGNNSTITNNNFDKNTAKGTLGGAIISLGNNTYIAENTFTNNIAERDGGAIDIEGGLIGDDSISGNNNIIENNIFTNNSARYGGAISFNGRSGKIFNNEFTKNHANELGGAIRCVGVSDISESIIENIFTNNDADISGGAIYTIGNQTTIEGNIFSNHKSNSVSASEGGAGGVITIKGDDCIITNNEFTNSSAQRHGGVIYADGNRFEITNNNFKNSQATLNGGAIFLEGDSPVITDNIFDDVKTKSNGGAIRAATNGAVISNNNISNTQADGSGGTFYLEGESIIVNNNNIENSVAKGQSGGAITVRGNSNEISENTLTSTQVNNYGGAIYYEGNNANIAKNIFTSNEAMVANGGAIYLNGNTASISDNEFKNGKSKQYGGAIFITGSDSTIKDNKFTNNTAKSGGAINSEKKITIENNEFKDNTATELGGALSLNGDNSVLNNNVFINNTAGRNGGAANVYGKEIKIENNQFIENFATGTGGALKLVGDKNTLNNNVFRKNNATGNGGAANIEGANTVITNNGFTENNAETPRLGGAIWFKGNNTEISSNKFNGNTARTGTAINGETSNTKVEKNTFYNSLESDGTLIRLVEGTNNIKQNNIYTTFDSTTTLTISDVTMTYGNQAKLTATLKDSKNVALANKKITITLNDKEYSATTDNKGQASIDLSGLNANTYAAAANFIGDKDYDPATATATVKINPAATITTLTGAQNVSAGTPVTLVAEVNATEGLVIFKINDNETSMDLTNGKATLKLTDLPNGIYKVTATYQDPNNNYISSQASASFEVTTTSAVLTANNLTLYIGGGDYLTIALIDNKGKGIAKKDIIITENGQSQTIATDSKGEIKLWQTASQIETRELSIIFEGDDEYAAASTTATVTVKSTIESEDLTANYNNAKFTAKFVDSNGKALAKGTYVSFTIDNDAYREAVDENSAATVTIDKDHGSYTITSVNTATGETKENKITINPVKTATILSGINNIEVGNNLTATASVNATEGCVIFNFNGQDTTVNLTEGKATFDLNDLSEGTYTVTATYKDENGNYLTSSANASFRVTKKLTTITVNDGDIYYGNDMIFVVTLTDSSSNPLAMKQIIAKIGNNELPLETGDNGKTQLQFHFDDVNNYTATFTFAGDDEYEPSNATSTVIVKSTIESEDLTADYNKTVYSARFLDSNGKPLAKGTEVRFTIGNEVFPANITGNGVATINIDKNHGKYTIINVNPATQETTENNIIISQVATETTLSGIKDIYVGDNITITANVNTTEGIMILKVNKDEVTFNLTDDPASLEFTALPEGTYAVTATYKDSNDNYLTSSANATFKVTKKATVLTAENVTMYYGANKNLTITLTDSESKALVGKEVIITYYGGTENETTDSDGQINIPLYGSDVGIFDLNISYAGDDEYESANTKVTITVLTTIEAGDVIADYNKAIFTARFLDTEGNPLKNGENVSFFIGNEVFPAVVADNGIATAVIDKDHGTYTISSYNHITDQMIENTITINQVATKTTLDEIADLNAGDNLTITAKVNATEGAVTFKVNKDEVTVNLTDGKATFDLTAIPEGSYSVTATFKDANDNYLTSSDSKTFKVSKKDNTITVETNNITEDEDAVFNVTATAPNGKVTLTINGKSYTENLTDGKATFTVSNLTSGDYPYKVTFEDDFYYASNSTEGILNVKSDNLVITAPDLTKYYHGPERFLVYVTDKEGNPLENITVQIVLNGVTYNRTTNASGIAGMNIGLGSNNYTAEVIYAGDAEHSSVNTTAKITVLPTVYGDDVTKIQRGPEPYYATFLDSAGNYLKDGTTVQFNINGVLYDRKVSGNSGVAKLNLNLEAGTYIITAINPVTGENAANNITIKPRIVNNSDVTKFYRNGTQYYVTILGDDGKAVGAGVTVKFNINGVFYERQTNASGVARLNLNLEPGKYIITAEYNNCRVSNNITVLPVLSAKDITMNYRDGTKFKATLVDGTGAPYAGETVTFNINGVFYDRVTDKDGVAALNINLMPGKYIITSSYNGANIANNVTIKA